MRDDPEVLGFKPPRTDNRTPLERDGLAHFGANIFLDPALADAGVETLAAQADYLQYQAPSLACQAYAALWQSSWVPL